MNGVIRIECPVCLAERVSSLGQTVVGDRLRWYRSTACPTCGAMEEDGEGFPPAEYRRMLVESAGSWKLVVDVSFKVRTLKVLKDVLGLSMMEAAAVRFPDVLIGTKAEVDWLASLLMNEGVEARGEPS